MILYKLFSKLKKTVNSKNLIQTSLIKRALNYRYLMNSVKSETSIKMLTTEAEYFLHTYDKNLASTKTSSIEYTGFVEGLVNSVYLENKNTELSSTMLNLQAEIKTIEKKKVFLELNIINNQTKNSLDLSQALMTEIKNLISRVEKIKENNEDDNIKLYYQYLQIVLFDLKISMISLSQLMTKIPFYEIVRSLQEALFISKKINNPYLELKVMHYLILANYNVGNKTIFLILCRKHMSLAYKLLKNKKINEELFKSFFYKSAHYYLQENKEYETEKFYTDYVLLYKYKKYISMSSNAEKNNLFENIVYSNYFKDAENSDMLRNIKLHINVHKYFQNFQNQISEEEKGLRYKTITKLDQDLVQNQKEYMELINSKQSITDIYNEKHIVLHIKKYYCEYALLHCIISKIYSNIYLNRDLINKSLFKNFEMMIGSSNYLRNYSLTNAYNLYQIVNIYIHQQNTNTLDGITKSLIHYNKNNYYISSRMKSIENLIGKNSKHNNTNDNFAFEIVVNHISYYLRYHNLSVFKQKQELEKLQEEIYSYFRSYDKIDSKYTVDLLINLNDFFHNINIRKEYIEKLNN